jgi:hypothetical protein
MFDHLHIRKIDMSDAIFVVDMVAPISWGMLEQDEWSADQLADHMVGYVGESTRREVDWTLRHDKPVWYLSYALQNKRLPFSCCNRQTWFQMSPLGNEDIDEATFKALSMLSGLVIPYKKEESEGRTTEDAVAYCFCPKCDASWESHGPKGRCPQP